MWSEINFWAVLVSAIASMVIGTIWYGPLFGKIYMRETGMDKMTEEEKAQGKKKMWGAYIGQFIASLVMFYILAYAIYAASVGMKDAIHMAIFAWLGFIVPVKLSDALWGGKMYLFWLSIGGQLVTLLAGAAIISLWM